MEWHFWAARHGKNVPDSERPTLNNVVAERKNDGVRRSSVTWDLISRCVTYRDRVGVERAGRICKQHLPSKKQFRQVLHLRSKKKRHLYRGCVLHDKRLNPDEDGWVQGGVQILRSIGISNLLAKELSCR